MTTGTDALRRLLDEVSARPPSPADPTIDGMSPSLVLEPDTDEAVLRALKLCHDESMAVVPFGGATRLGLGNPPKRLDVCLATSALDGVIDHIPGDLTVAVRAGTRVDGLQAALAKEGQFLPIDPPRPSRATVGGVFAVAEPGFRRRPGARPRDLLIGFEGALADGTLVKAGGRVVKNVAGYEITKLFTGSAGTLAVMTKAFLRLRALPESKTTLRAGFSRPSDAARAYRVLASTHAEPEASALLNPEGSRAVGLDDWSLVLRFEGLSEEVSAKVALAREHLWGSAEASDEADREIWDFVRDFPVPEPEAENAGLGLRGQVVSAATFELAGLWQDGGALVAHPDAGLVYSRTEDLEALNDRLEAARHLGGNVILERAPASVKSELDVYGESPDSLPLMKDVKNKLDPNGVLSPGRFVGKL